MFKIQTWNKISPAGLSLLRMDRYDVASEQGSPHAFLLRSAMLLEENIGESVKAIARVGIGVNNIPIDACTKRGIAVFNTPGANANSVKELVIAGLLLSSRGIHEGLNWVEKQVPDGNFADKVEQIKSTFAGNEIAGKSLGIIGLGAIGVLVANAAVELGMKVYGFDPFISINAAWGLSRRVLRINSLDQLLSVSDYITLHLPLTGKTEKMLNADRLKKSKRGQRILNFSRGSLVDRMAIKSALENGIIARYITDFPSPELYGVKGVMSLPHIGASTVEAEDNCAIMAVNQLRDFLENGCVKNSVNFPECSIDPFNECRLLVANHNVPNMLSQILEILAQENLNVEEMVNKHRDQIAYNIIDLSAPCVSELAMNRLRDIEGVVMTRQIAGSTG